MEVPAKISFVGRRRELFSPTWPQCEPVMGTRHNRELRTKIDNITIVIVIVFHLWDRCSFILLELLVSVTIDATFFLTKQGI